jgi:hypothetical protein
MLSSFLLKHGRLVSGVLIGLLVTGLSFYGGFEEGKKRAPLQPGTVTEKIVEKQTQVINQKVDLQELTKMIQDAVKNVKVVAHVTTKTVKAPDGTVTTERTVDTQRDSHSEVKTDSSKETKSETQVQTKIQIERVVDRVEVFVPKLREPTWDLLIGAGASVPAFLGDDAPKSYLPFMPAKFAGALTLTHHVAGPVKAGLSLNTRGDLMFVVGYSK